MSTKKEMYRIRIEGHVSLSWSAWIEEVSVQYAHGETILTALFSDQTALHGALMRVRDLGLSLIEVKRMQTDLPDQMKS